MAIEVDITRQGIKAQVSIPEGHFYRAVLAIEEALVFAVLDRTNGNKKDAAKLLGIKRSTLGMKMHKWETEKAKRIQAHLFHAVWSEAQRLIRTEGLNAEAVLNEFENVLKPKVILENAETETLHAESGGDGVGNLS